MAYTVLVADDSKTIRTVLERTLSVSGLEVSACLQAGNGREALEVLRAHWVDLVLTDINMPEMVGLELVRTMAADELLRSVPVVVISTEGSEQRIDELRRHGIKGYIRKPFTPEQVKEVVDDVLGSND